VKTHGFEKTLGFRRKSWPERFKLLAIQLRIFAEFVDGSGNRAGVGRIDEFREKLAD